jgi:hypothetical protein
MENEGMGGENRRGSGQKGSMEGNGSIFQFSIEKISSVGSETCAVGNVALGGSARPCEE